MSELSLIKHGGGGAKIAFGTKSIPSGSSCKSLVVSDLEFTPTKVAVFYVGTEGCDSDSIMSLENVDGTTKATYYSGGGYYTANNCTFTPSSGGFTVAVPSKYKFRGDGTYHWWATDQS